MALDPRADLRDTLSGVLLTAYRLDEALVPAFVDDVVARHLSIVDVGGAGFELLEVTLAWRALCGDVAEGRVALAGGAFPGWVLLGGLRWIDQMRSLTTRAGRLSAGWEAADVDHVEAAACMAFWGLDADPPPPGPSDRLGALQERVEALLAMHGLSAAGRSRIREARVRLERLRCIGPHRGWFGLRDEVSFQVVGD